MMPSPALFKVAKVVAVNPESHALDIAYLDGGFASNVPALSQWAGTTHGTVFTPIPTYESNVPQRKTYPFNTSMKFDEETNPDKTGQDQYVLVVQLEGSLTGLGQSGAIVLGYIYPQVSEMLFAAGENKEFHNFYLFRHPSDLEEIRDKTGKWALQHPSGTRAAMGENTDRVVLREKDYDKRYRLRRNIERAVNWLLRVVRGGLEQSSLALMGGAAELYGLASSHLKNLFAEVSLLESGDIVIDTHDGRGPETEPTESGEDNSGLPSPSPNGGNIFIRAKKDIEAIADGNVKVSGIRIDLN